MPNCGTIPLTLLETRLLLPCQRESKKRLRHCFLVRILVHDICHKMFFSSYLPSILMIFPLFSLVFGIPRVVIIFVLGVIIFIIFIEWYSPSFSLLFGIPGGGRNVLNSICHQMFPDICPIININNISPPLPRNICLGCHNICQIIFNIICPSSAFLFGIPGGGRNVLNSICNQMFPDICPIININNISPPLPRNICLGCHNICQIIFNIICPSSALLFGIPGVVTISA